ncbi:hypothetical protein [Stutzerimonas zhaodongensis]
METLRDSHIRLPDGSTDNDWEGCSISGIANWLDIHKQNEP